MSGHTPTPWNLYDDTDTPNKRIEIVAIGKTIAHIYHSVAEEDLPNAAFIVEAVNSHATLLSQNAKLREALECLTSAVEFMRTVGGYRGGSHRGMADLDRAEEQAHDALAEPQL